jgi:hypothetical protein
MSRRPVAVTQAEIQRAIRAAKREGADSVEVRPDGTVTFLLKGVPLTPPDPEDAFAKWEREYEQEKASRGRQRN